MRSAVTNASAQKKSSVVPMALPTNANCTEQHSLVSNLLRIPCIILIHNISGEGFHYSQVNHPPMFQNFNPSKLQSFKTSNIQMFDSSKLQNFNPSKLKILDQTFNF